MADVATAIVLDPPPLSPPPNGLLKAATVIDHSEGDDRWIGGIRFQRESTEAITGFDPCGTTSDVISTFTDGTTTVNSTNLGSATANFNSSDVGKTVVSTGTANAVFADGVTATDTSLTSATAGFTANDVGKTVTGAGIPASTTISSVTNATTVVLSQATTATASGVSITIVARKVIFTGSTIASVTNSTTAVLSTPAKATSTGLTFSISGRTDSLNGSGEGLALAFGLQAKAVCSAFTGKADWEGRARRRLAAQESAGVEREFELATIRPENRHLQDSTNTTILNSGTAVGLITALKLLVQAIADNKLGMGMIHARPGIVTAWSSQDLLTITNGKIYTYNGNLVVPGSGYSGASPAGVAATATSEWAYATDPVQVHRGAVQVTTPEPVSAANFDRATNTVTVRAQNMYAIVANFSAVLAININPAITGVPAS